jgi:hypothetical protein
MELQAISKLWNEAKPRTQGLPYIKPGNYTLEIENCKLVDSQKSADTFFVTEFKVVESSNEEFKAGDMVCVMGNMKHKPVVSDTREFIATCTQAAFDSVTPEVLAAVTHPEKNSLKGTVVHCTATDVASQKTGALFTRHRWRLVSVAPGLKKGK